mmetsp:Transcript_27102/g.94026  ORF Transcript_27102/g.94026 Transcript_27102/m.94026 type:complete len:225 (+) Transcript_27102:1714-2388(+)
MCAVGLAYERCLYHEWSLATLCTKASICSSVGRGQRRQAATYPSHHAASLPRNHQNHEVPASTPPAVGAPLASPHVNAGPGIASSNSSSATLALASASSSSAVGGGGRRHDIVRGFVRTCRLALRRSTRASRIASASGGSGADGADSGRSPSRATRRTASNAPGTSLSLPPAAATSSGWAIPMASARLAWRVSRNVHRPAAVATRRAPRQTPAARTTSMGNRKA